MSQTRNESEFGPKQDSQEIAPDYVEEDRDVGKPMQLLVPNGTESGNTLRLLNKLQSVGYEVSKEHHSDHQTVYNVYPKPERSTPANRVTPTMRGESIGEGGD